MRLLLALVWFGISLCGVRAASPDALHSALENGDTHAMIRTVETLFEDAGISLHDGLVWDLQPYDYTFNYYDQYEQKIVLGAIPAAADVADYWDNWSQTLTGGNWQRTGFFTSDADAAMLAAYNAFIIAAHELGHAVTYRYDPEYQVAHDYSVNCRELAADRFSTALAEELAAADPRFAALLARYVEVMASMNASIAEADRYHIDNLAALEADCNIIEVAQPTPETLQPYASAFFERLRLLFGATLPSLAEVANDRLETSRAAFMATMPYGAEADTRRLTTLTTLPGFSAVDRYSQGEGAFAGGFDLGGQLYLGQMIYDAETATINFSYGPPGALEPVATSHPYLRSAIELELLNIAPLSADRFFAAIREPRDSRVVLLLGQRGAAGWTLDAVSELDDMQVARVLQTPDGGAAFLASPDANISGSNDGWIGVRFDPQSFEGMEGFAFQRIYGLPLALRTDGNLLTYGFDLLYDFNRELGFDVLAGNHLEGSKDGDDPRRMEFMDLAAAQELPDGRILLLDQTADGKAGLIRELRPTQ